MNLEMYNFKYKYGFSHHDGNVIKLDELSFKKPKRAPSFVMINRAKFRKK